MGNFRQKMRAAGCSEVKINARNAGPPVKKLKRAKKSEVNFLPDFPEGKDELDLEKERCAMIIEMSKRKVDWKLIDELMNITFSLRRKEIVHDEPLVARVQERWPALFNEKQIEAEFSRLTSVNLKTSFFNGLDYYQPGLLDLYKAKAGKVAALRKLMACLNDQSTTQRKREVVLLGLPHFLKEDPICAFKTAETTDEEASITEGLKVGVVTIKDGEDIVATSLVLEEQIILHDVKDFTQAIALLMGLLFSLNIDYPRGLRYTFEVVQKVFMDIGGGQCSSMVHGLRNRLLRNAM
ncbi:uncharacterized protein LOC112149902 [Oryzias melastigma]|uniref:uncharacterized protein LOC112149902 n=1 Tax=Oryzias melastigma TaxID=30732 RepID=UPI000CF7DD5D|nr:uncharacterized protein LOC112149902 [Oryzias melastigma]